MATERWGIKTFDDDGYINLHSDYSSIVYVGEMFATTTPVQPVYAGESNISLIGRKISNYDMGWTVQYIMFDVNSSFMLPFYRPVYSGQQIAIMDVVKKDSTTWLVNLLFEGTVDQIPRIFAFAPLNAIPEATKTTGERGLRVYDQSGGLVFNTTRRPLRVDDVVLIQHPTAIKTGSRGGCGNDHGCHVNFTSDQSATYTGTTTNTSTKIYHIVPSAYGGLAYKNSGSGDRSCGFAGLGSREYAWAYQSWASFRGTIGHTYNTKDHKADWLGDYAGAYHVEQQGDCGLGGILGILLGGLAAFFTLGAALIIGGTLLGFALGDVDSVPSIKAYEADATTDTNTATNLIITDAEYYNIDVTVPQIPIAYYIISATTYIVKEGTTITFDVEGFNITNGRYYWTINNTTTTNSDFPATSGFFTITNNVGQFIVSVGQDYTRENNETFTVSIRTGSITGPIVKTSGTVTLTRGGDPYIYYGQYGYPPDFQYTFSQGNYAWVEEYVYTPENRYGVYNILVYYEGELKATFFDLPYVTTSINGLGYTYVRGRQALSGSANITNPNYPYETKSYEYWSIYRYPMNY